MNTAIGWSLAAAALALGYLQWGWPGVALAVTLIVFWLLLQFSRALRALRKAGRSPMGHIDNAVMLNARLQRGQRLAQILALTRSLGLKLSDNPEAFEWRDAGGDAVRVEMVSGKLARWELQRAKPASASETD